MLDPGFEALMDRGFGAVMGGKLAPLTASSGQPDQPVEDGAGVPWGTPAFLAKFLDDQQRCEATPQVV